MKLYSLALALLATVAVAQTPTQPVCSVGATCKMVNGKVVVIALTPAPAPKPSACQPNGKGCVAIAAAQTPAPKPMPQSALVPTAHCMCFADGNHHCSIIGLSPGTRLACETVDGTWVEPAPLTYTPLNMNSTVVSGDVHVDLNVPGSVSVNSQTGRVVKLSDEEYARLQKLRQAVADEEKKIAVAHGVDTTGCMPHGDTFCTKDGDLFHGGQIVPAWFPDRYEFRGQWLLINVPPSAKEGK